MNHDALKARQRAERHAHPPNLALRVHRALSWLHRAELQAAQGDPDGEFIFLWIAFNAAYASEIDERYRLNEQATFRAFLQKLVDLDAGPQRIAGLVWTAFPGPIRVLLARIYTLRNQLMHGGATWNSSVNRDQIRDCTALMAKLVPLVIEIMLDHPETLWGDAVYPVVD